jgi:hypothetical protein
MGDYTMEFNKSTQVFTVNSMFGLIRPRIKITMDGRRDNFIRVDALRGYTIREIMIDFAKYDEFMNSEESRMILPSLDGRFGIVTVLNKPIMAFKLKQLKFI